MTDALIIDYTVRAMSLVLWLSLPPIIVAIVFGIAVSLFQALTQIQEQTLSFGVKLVAVTATLLFTAGWIGSELMVFTTSILEDFGRLTQ